jgi:hypothetical protein
VYPGALVPDIGQLEKIGIEVGLIDGALEERLMGPWRAGRHHHPVQVVFLDGLFDLGKLLPYCFLPQTQIPNFSPNMDKETMLATIKTPEKI